MPELPDLEAYVHALRERIVGATLRGIRLGSPFLLRTVSPPLGAATGKRVAGVRRVGKRIVLSLEDGPHLALHLMVLGRLAWKKPGAKLGGRAALAAMDFDEGTLVLTESGSRHRAALHVVDDDGLKTLDAGGIEPLASTQAQLAEALRRENHTLKRALTDPRLVAGIGNAYSDEILHRAGLPPTKLTATMDDDELHRLHRAVQETLGEWTRRLVAEAEKKWPDKVTAFRPEMAVHGKFGEACPVCGTTVQRIVRGENESNYCPRCQTGGKMLADRALSRLLHDDWPATIDEWEERVGRR